MRRVRGKTDPAFVPDYMATSIADIDFDQLHNAGVRYIALDADNTLVPFFGVRMDPKSKRLLSRELKKFDGACIASNRLTDNLKELAADIGLEIVWAGIFIRKPKRRYFKRVLRHFRAKPHEVAMVGDKLRADIWGGNRVGLVTVWVQQLGRDYLLDRLLRVRWFEQKVLNRYMERSS